MGDRRRPLSRSVLRYRLAIVVATSLFAAMAAPAPPEAIPGGDWPTYRHDAALSAVSPLKGGLGQAPSIAWSIDLGGPRVVAQSVQVRDVTGDGRDEILILDSDGVECRDARGQRLWALDGYVRPSIIDIRDYAGDGSRGILLTTARGGRVETFMVVGRSGQAIPLWADENNFGGHTRFGKLLPGVTGAQVASTYSGQTPPGPQAGAIRLISFESGLDQPRFRIRHFLAGTFYSPLMFFDDLDADGKVEMAVVSHEALWSFDTENGRQELNAVQYAPMIRTYAASIASVRLAPDDPYPSMVMTNPNLPGLKAIKQDGKTSASTVWKVVLGPKEDQYQGVIRIEPAGPDVASDLNGDGRYEVLALITNEHGDGSRHLVIFEAATGKRLAELGDTRILSVDDLDGDGRPEVLLQEGPKFLVTRWTGEAFRTLWRGDDGSQPILRPLPAEGDLRRTRGGNSLVWRESPGSDRFLFRFPDGVSACRWVGDQNVRMTSVATHEALGNVATTGSSPAEKVTWDGRAAVTSVGSTEVYRYEPPAPQTYLAPPPLVADLAGSRQILVRDAAGKVLAVPPGGGSSRVFIDHPSERIQGFTDATGSGPTVCDVDGDGENDVVATVEGSDGIPFCAILDGRGALKRRIDLEPGAQLMNRGPTGSLGAGRGRWILLRMFFGDGSYQGRRPVVVAFDGKTGERLWARDHYSHYGPNPVVFAAHFPTAVYDFDGDGADDWLVCSENFYGVISVKDNRDLVGPVVLSDALPRHWTAYSFPSLGDVGGKGEISVLHNSSYALALITDLKGQPIWHHGLTRDTASTWSILADVDGDKAREMVHVQPDGLMRCFKPNDSRQRCETCPPDSALDKPPAGEKSVRWSIDLKRPVSRMVAADLDNDGRHEVVFGGRDGKLYALGEREGQPRIVWSVSLGRPVGEPVLADLDGDGKAEILVNAEDGRLYCLRGGGSGAK